MTNRKLQKPIRKSFTFLTSGQKKETKQDSSENLCQSSLQRNSSQKEVPKKPCVFHKRFSQTRIKNSLKNRSWNARLFKHVQKKKIPTIVEEEDIQNKIDKQLFRIGLKSRRLNLLGKLSKRQYKASNLKKKTKTLPSEETKTAQSLQRAFSLRLKSRTESRTEKIDISSLVKIVHFERAGMRLASDCLSDSHKFDTVSMETTSEYDAQRPKLQRTCSLKQPYLEPNFMSPTCGDIYGVDEEGNLSFNHESDNILKTINNTTDINREVTSATLENDNIDTVSTAIHADGNTYKRIKDNELTENCETYSNITFHLSEKAKPYNGEKSLSTMESSDNFKEENAAFDKVDISSFKKRLSSDNCDIVIETLEDPWVLKSDFEETDKLTNNLNRLFSEDSSPVYESLGFSVKSSNIENSLLSPNSAKRKQVRNLKRSASIESLDSFNSSIHSVNSEECLFSSDSEGEIEDDQASVSSSDSFASAKDYTEEKDIEKMKRSSSLDSINTASSPVGGEVKPLETFNALDSMPVAKPLKSTYSVDDVHRIIQRPRTLSIKGYSLDSAPKSDKKKEKNKRRSLDSSFKTAEIKSDFKNDLERHKQKSASSDSGLSSVLSPVLETGDVKLHSLGNFDASSDKMYYTLPNPRKKSFPPPFPKKKATRIGSLSKMLTEKAESLSGLKLGTSFKLRNLEKPITSGLNKTKSLTSLMSKKGSAVVSSISSLIKGKSTSETNLDTIDSPFKPRNRKTRKNEEEGSVFIYEKVKVLVPRKRPANAQELVAKRKRLTLDLELSNLKQTDIENEFRKDSNSGVSSMKKCSLSSPHSTSSIGSVRSPLLLDEVMKSVDTRRFSAIYALDIENGSDAELDETSSRSSSFVLLTKERSAIYDIATPGSVFISGGDYFQVCPRCKKTKPCLERDSDLSGLELEEKRTQSLFNLNSFCTCSRLRNTCDTFTSVRKRKLHSDLSNECLENDGSLVLASTPVIKRQTSLSLQELRYFSDLPFQNYMLDDSLQSPRNGSVTDSFLNDCKSTVDSKPNLRSRRSLPYSLMKCEPCLDLSADDLDEIGSFHDDGTAEESYQRNVEKAHSCSDLLDNTDGTSEIDPLVYSSKPLERKPSKRGDRPVKVKSLSSSHDALRCLAAVDIPFADDMGSDNIILESDLQNSTGDFTLKKQEIEKELDSSDSGNEDYQSVGSEAELVDLPNEGLIRSEESLQLPKSIIDNEKLHLDSDSILSNYKQLSNSYPDIEAVHVCENCISKRQTRDSFKILGRYDLNFNLMPFLREDKRPVLKQIRCSGCFRLRTEDFLKSNKQENIPLVIPRKCLSVTDVGENDCDKNKFGGCMQKSLSVSKVHDSGAELPKVNRISNNSKLHETSSHSVVIADSKSLQTKPNTSMSGTRKFLFDDHHIKTYKTTEHLGHTSRIKSISSDDINNQTPIDSKIGPKSISALSLNKVHNELPSYAHDNKLYLNQDFFPPNLTPLTSMFKLPPFQGFSAFSPPPVDGQVPELEEIFKYDVCLGYLLHSITCDNKTICVYSLQRNKQLMEGVITPISGLPGAPHTRPSESSHGNKQKTQQRPKPDDLPNPAAPITVVPSEKLSHAGHVLRTVLLSRASHMIRDRKFHLRTYRRCMVGTEMVDWLLQQSSLVHSRTQAVGMWQALVEEGVVVHVCHEHQFKDKYLFYRFREDDQGVSTVPSSVSKKECEDDLQEVFLMLAQIGPDAMMRMILRKVPHERTVEDLEIIYEELLHIKALSHLSTMVKRELASVLVFESHAKSGTVLFNQGDEGKSWYIILKGSVNVVIYGKGVVCTLHEGDDFGKLALVNDAPRAATIVLRDDNCHFLRVDKDDFNRILRDVEANTVRLKEHGQDVLVLEKIPTNTQSADGTVQAHYKYSIMAGTPEKMLEHLLETRLDNKGEEELGMYRDGFLEDFLLTHVIFMPCNHLCPVLLSHYHSSMSDSTEQENFEFMLNHKKCVLHFVQEWATIVGNAFREDHTINAFLEELHSCLLEDQQCYTSLREDVDLLENILEAQGRLVENQLLTSSGTQATLTRKSSKENADDGIKKNKIMRAADENIFKVYCADHTYCTLRLPMDASVEQIISSARDKLCLGDELVLCEVKSTGERITFKENDLCVTSGLSINGRLFITPREHLDALTPLPEQEGPGQGSVNTIELVSSREMAYYMTVYDWDLFSCVQEYELIYQVFGRYKFHKITANLDLFLRRFNEIQFWVVTEMVLATNLSKRVALLRKFIKLASHCKDYQNLNSFFAIVMGLSNIAVSRLSQTWEKLPGKFKKMFADFETLMDPSRNHRVYRLSVAKMVPPIIPFMPLLMKDMTFTHEGNKTYFDGLVNFEKMHMIAQTLKTVRFCRSSALELEAPSSLKSADISQFIRNLHVIDNQRHLTQLSHKLEPRKT